MLNIRYDMFSENTMTVTLRNYQHPKDYQRVSEFLISNHETGNLDGNWLEPAWEYMHFHPALQSEYLSKIGIWEKNGQIVAVVHYEGNLGEAFFQFQPAYRHLREEMLDYAEKHLPGTSKKGERKYLCAYVNDNDPEFLAVMRKRGYQKDAEATRPLYRSEIPAPFPPIPLTEGFRLTSLADECDWAKVHQVMWRGFDHGDNVPMTEEEFDDRRKMFDTPKARRELKIAVAAPNGEFAAFCGMFFDESGKFAYVEPVATDPRYRRLGLGRAAVLEGIRRCGLLGATIAYVGSDQPFYQSLGFKKVYNSEGWVRDFAGGAT
jgi:GNAT superfamily N-acetyltransferase